MLLVLKAGGLVRAIAKWLVRGMAATAEADGGASAESVRAALHVDDFEIPFDAQ